MDVGKAKVINPGSLGLQRDGNPMARYAIIENGQVELKQIEYDYEATVAALGTDWVDRVMAFSLSVNCTAPPTVVCDQPSSTFTL